MTTQQEILELIQQCTGSLTESKAAHLISEKLCDYNYEARLVEYDEIMRLTEYKGIWESIAGTVEMFSAYQESAFDHRHTNWYQLIERQLEKVGDSFQNFIALYYKGKFLINVDKMTELLKENIFDSTYGHLDGLPFTLWTNEYVYFPLKYDGSEYVGFAPRNPAMMSMDHQ